MTQPRQTFEQAVNDFIYASPWIGPEHSPAVAMLYSLAAEMDGGDLQPAMAAQFGLAYRSLAKLAPSAVKEDDPLEAALRDAAA